jgi:adenosylcobinamide-GDP ribazoletransferase
VRLWNDLLAAFGFLTLLPTPRYSYDDETTARSAKFYPVVGLVVAALAYAVYWLLKGHVKGDLQSASVLVMLVMLTGGFHEEGLADVADGFGGGGTRERILEIMHDSRIGGYGALVLTLSLLLRFALLTDLPIVSFWPYLAGAQILCRWSILPLAMLLPPARPGGGKGSLLAGKLSKSTFVAGTLLALGVCIYILRLHVFAPVVVCLLIVLLSATYYRRRIGGITGDCFGATMQAVEVAIYFCGVWH